MLCAQIQEPCASPLESQQRSGRSGAAATDRSSMTWPPAWSFELNHVAWDVDLKIHLHCVLLQPVTLVSHESLDHCYWPTGYTGKSHRFDIPVTFDGRVGFGWGKG